MFNTVTATAAEAAAPRAGDDIIVKADVVMNRAFTVTGRPDTVWPWIEQLGKGRAGWYLPSRLEAVMTRGRRASRAINAQWLNLHVGDVIADYGGRNATFTVARISPPNVLVYQSTRGRVDLSWSITLIHVPVLDQTRVLLRLRLAPVRRKWRANTLGELLDVVTVAGLAAGLRERLNTVEPTATNPQVSLLVDAPSASIRPAFRNHSA